MSGAYTAFERQLLDASDALSQAKAAIPLALWYMYQGRCSGEPVGQDEVKRAGGLVARVRAIMSEDDSAAVRAYDFEIEILEELLWHGVTAYPASPREETSQSQPHYNHDLYFTMGRTEKPRKVPISAKLGGKCTMRYGGGVRCISAKRASRIGLWPHLKREIPELSLVRHDEYTEMA